VQGVGIRAYVDDVLAIDTDDSHIGGGALLLSVGPGTHAQFDSIRVTTIGE